MRKKRVVDICYSISCNYCN